MATPIDNHPRPSLHPLWASQYTLGGFPRSSARPAPTSYFSPSDKSPKSLPTPVFPSNDGSMRQHERAMVDRLGHRIRQAQRIDPSPPKPVRRPTPLSPLAEHSADGHGRRYSTGPISPRYSNGPISPRYPAAPVSPRRTIPPPPVTPVSPPMPSARRQTLAAENRSMLLSGLGEESQRRQSVPSAAFLARSKDAEKRHQLEQLRAWGHVYLGDAKTSDVFVQAVSLRRQSDASNSSENSSSPGDSSPTRMPPTPTVASHQTAVRARVRPRALERKPFLIQRVFDIEQLRSTVADPLPSSPSTADPARRRPSLVGSPRPSMARRRSSSAAHSPLPYTRGLKSGDSRVPSSRGATTMPIHLQYARSSLPVLAALIVSGHISPGDVIDLPLPYPEVWASTVAYVYTGQGDLTDAVRENIRYLAGKV